MSALQCLAGPSSVVATMRSVVSSPRGRTVVSSGRTLLLSRSWPSRGRASYQLGHERSQSHPSPRSAAQSCTLPHRRFSCTRRACGRCPARGGAAHSRGTATATDAACWRARRRGTTCSTASASSPRSATPCRRALPGCLSMPTSAASRAATDASVNAVGPCPCRCKLTAADLGHRRPDCVKDCMILETPPVLGAARAQPVRQ